jgi:hypothetical protein
LTQCCPGETSTEVMDAILDSIENSLLSFMARYVLPGVEPATE